MLETLFIGVLVRVDDKVTLRPLMLETHASLATQVGRAVPKPINDDVNSFNFKM